MTHTHTYINLYILLYGIVLFSRGGVRESEGCNLVNSMKWVKIDGDRGVVLCSVDGKWTTNAMVEVIGVM